jgi:hypothetical protein
VRIIVSRQRWESLGQPAILQDRGGTVVIEEPMGLGDYVAALTSAVGIKPCGGCKERQAAWNAFGKRFGIGLPNEADSRSIPPEPEAEPCHQKSTT